MSLDGYTLRTADPADWDRMAPVLFNAFNDDVDDEVAAMERAVWQPERTVLAVRDAGSATADDEIAGCAGVYSRELTVPGAIVPAGHVSMVTVAAEHRRRGLMTAMMRVLLERMRAAGEPVAVLWASEGRIYQRLGFGLASLAVSITARHDVRLLGPDPQDSHRLQVMPAAQALADLSAVHELRRPHQVGWSSRDDGWWQHLLADPVGRRQGGTAQRAVLHHGDRGVDGYALYRLRNDWDASGPAGVVRVNELVATDPGAYRRLWGFLLGMDLTRTVKLRWARPDEPLIYLVDEPRLLQLQLSDGLWLRILDLPAALQARRYPAPVDVVLQVDDELIPANAGRWRLIAEAGGSRCEPTDSPADLACHIAALGAAYLGGASLAALGGAGRVRELRPGTLHPAGRALGWDLAPGGIEVF